MAEVGMLGVYLFTLVLGGGLLLMTLFAGDGEGSAGDVDVDVDLDVDTGIEVEADAEAATAHAGAGGATAFVLGLFKPRNLTFLLAAFGTTGSLLTWLGRPAVSTFVLSLGMGITAMAFTHLVFTWIHRTDNAADVLGDTDLEGSLARVVLPLSPGQRGRIACRAAGREVYVTAHLAPSVTEPIAAGREVLIIRSGDGEAEVVPSPDLQLPSDTSRS